MGRIVGQLAFYVVKKNLTFNQFRIKAIILALHRYFMEAERYAVVQKDGELNF
ncbi:MAG: hypothetical protein K9J37_05510 [Saprospiraceae bacterium]|nr:hypothetical protein [Saprospiraceae bacterium]MCF8249347.1 hypothetical protein [Saprospiraceae bacterium]MCF8311376.1 hypothetical protein [Saprospiraceae bacterium]MCF8439966.1 hypothetical protein [Saprospiraceae bacterium]